PRRGGYAERRRRSDRSRAVDGREVRVRKRARLADRDLAGGGGGRGGVVGGGRNVLWVLPGATGGAARSDRGVAARIAYNSICAPISTTRFGGSPKNAVAVREFLDKNANSA